MSERQSSLSEAAAGPETAGESDQQKGAGAVEKTTPTSKPAPSAKPKPAPGAEATTKVSVPAEATQAIAAPTERQRPPVAASADAPTTKVKAPAPAAPTPGAPDPGAAAAKAATPGAPTPDGAKPGAPAPGTAAPGAATPGASTPGAPKPGAVAGSGASAPSAPQAPAAPPSAPRPGGFAGAGPDTSWFMSPLDTETTQVIPRATTVVMEANMPSERPTEVLPVTAPPPPPPPPPSPPQPKSQPPAPKAVPAAAPGIPDIPAPPWVQAPAEKPRRGKRLLLVAGGTLLVLGLAYGGDLLLGSGSVPRGVVVAGVDVGGLALDAAEQKLRAEIEPRTARPIAVTAGDAHSEIEPDKAGLAVDWATTMKAAGAQPLNPITRISSFFSQREVGVVSTTNGDALTNALGELAPIVDKAPVEGAVRFEHLEPTPVEPAAGQKLDVAAAADVLVRDWANGASVALPMIELPPFTTHEDVVKAIDGVAAPAVAAPITIAGENGTNGTIDPDVIAKALSFRPGQGGGLVPELSPPIVSDAVRPQLASSEQPGRDATIDFSSGRPVVVPSQDGRGVDFEKTLANILPVLTAPEPRQITAVYGEQPAELTTDELKALGITGEIGSFTTGGFAPDSGQNIKRAAQQINGKIVKPGETFSLNDATGRRDAAQGYVEAGIISDGHPARGIGGGVSQIATTLYNASYFAGMTDVGHKEHSFYISRYPAAREATVFEGVIDLRFRNDNPTGVLIQTVWTPGSITVRLFGTKRYDVTSTPGPRTNPTDPNTVNIPDGEECKPSQGAPGFTATDTRTLRDINTGQSRSETRTVRYNPSPIVECGG